MQTVNDETLVLFYYGELDDPAADALRAELAGNEMLAARLAALAAELDALPDIDMPERDSNYGRRVWARVDAALDEAGRKGGSWLKLPFLSASGFRWAGGMAALAAVAMLAFQVGRMAPPQMPEPVMSEMATGDSRARLLEASLVNHFDSADRLLTEIANSDAAGIDVESEKEWAKVLLVANRLYRFAAEQAGQHRIAQLLGDMEPVLIELANGAGQLTPDEYRVLRQSISERDLVFKVRTTNMTLKQPQTEQL